jgi:tetratricopeptide (TPR) repeat protein
MIFAKSRSFVSLRTTLALGMTMGALSACAPKTASAPAASTPAPVADAPPACPDATDTPPVIENTIGNAYRVFKANAARTIPSCFVETVGSNPGAYSETALASVAEMSDAIYARNPDDAANLAGRVALLARMTRYKEVPPTFDRLVRLDPSRATLANYRLAIAAAMRGNLDEARLRYLTAAARKFPSATSIVADYNIQRQVPRLRALIDSSHQVLRLSPQRIERYATLASIYGNLDMPDSALYYTRRALAAGVPRNDVAPSLQSLIGVTLRKAQLLDDWGVWDKTLPLAVRIDSTLPTDASKHLLGITWVQVAANYVTMARYSLGGTEAELAVHARPLADAPTRAKACQALAMVPGFLENAATAFQRGGARYSPESVPALQSAMANVQSEQVQLIRRCPP